MNNFEKIVSRNNGWVYIEDLIDYKKIGKGSDGSIFQLTPEKCIKIFEKEETCRNELVAYQAGKSSSVIPTLYEYGRNYIVIEYINGPSLRHYLKKENQLSESTAQKLLFMLDEFKRIGFTRLDTQIRHIFVNELREIKVIDHKRAFNRKTNIPVRLLKDLKKIGYLDEFLKYVKIFRPSLYKEWKDLTD
ncbi:kinase [Bacillus salipaludis]|uniref:kinase n=1 Tax=Bacillus salipaludis TaxID=2547811 RepID=UPI002E1A1852|nr:kinase [Bacillus salipaludis]